MSTPAEHISAAQFGCGVVSTLLQKRKYDDALHYATEVCREIQLAKLKDTETRNLKPLRVIRVAIAK